MPKTQVVLQKTMDFEHISEDPNDFVDIIDCCKAVNVYKLITMNQDHCPELIHHFYATVHFHHDSERPMTWMSGSHKIEEKPLSICSCSWV